MTSIIPEAGSFVWLNKGSFGRLIAQPLPAVPKVTLQTSAAGLFYAPTAAQAFLLALIAYRESSDNYTALNSISSASGRYQIIDGTWVSIARNTGVGIQYARAYEAPRVDQDYNALWLLLQYGPNSKYSWAASGPYPTLDECDFAMRYA